MIYNLNGAQLSTAYDVDGVTLAQAYDIDGNPLIEQITADLVVMSYNVQWFSGINANKAMQQSIINSYNADIIGIQETGSPMPEVGYEVLTDYPNIAFGIQTNISGIASKLALSNVTAANFSRKASEYKGYQKAYFTVNGHSICWINAHLETSTNETVKVAQAVELFNLVGDEDYFIITADMNTTCKSVNDIEYSTIMSQFVNAGYHCANCTNQHGFLDTWTSGSTASGTWYPCDHVITSDNIDIVNVIVDTTKIDVAAQTGQSIDHLPIIAYLNIN